MVASIVFIVLIVVGTAFFGINVMRIRKNILQEKTLIVQIKKESGGKQ